MKFSTVLVVTAGVYRVFATIIGAPLCLAACVPLLINPIAYAACAAGCSALAVSENEVDGSPRFLPDGTVVFEKESSLCAEACKPLVGDQLAYAACLAGCSAVTGEKK